MKKFFIHVVTVCMIFCLFGMQAFAELDAETADVQEPLLTVNTETVRVYVVIAHGSNVYNETYIDAYDRDGDGSIAINDALLLAHETGKDAPGADGYGYATTEFGLSMTKLWGIENGGAYGYYVNNAPAMSLADPIKNGDQINAFVYTDTTAWSDKYCYFDSQSKSLDAGESVTVTLYSVGYDADYNTVVSPVADAGIAMGGTQVCKTDSEGKFTITLNAEGQLVFADQTFAPSVVNDNGYYIPFTVMSESANLVTPVLRVYINDYDNPATSDSFPGAFCAVIASAAVIVCLAKMLSDEKK